MTETVLVALVLLAIVPWATARAIGPRLERVADQLGALKTLLEAEFGKEQEYYKAKERSEKKYAEWMQMTRGLGPLDTVPEPARPPAIVAIAEVLGSIDSHLAHLRRLVEAGGGGAGSR